MFVFIGLVLQFLFLVFFFHFCHTFASKTKLLKDPLRLPEIQESLLAPEQKQSTKKESSLLQLHDGYLTTKYLALAHHQ